MRKVLALLTAVMLTVLCVGCGKEKAAKPIIKAFTCSVAVTYNDLHIEGQLERIAVGNLALTLTEPKTLAGLKISRSPEDTALQIGKLRYTLEGEPLQDATVELVLGVLDDVLLKAADGELQGNTAEFKGKINGMEYTVKCDAKTGILLALDVPGVDLKVTFHDFQKTE